jgi:hypothetical protein
MTMDANELRTLADAQPVAMLASHRRLIEQAIQSAEHPSGMSTHDGKARIDASVLRRMLAIIDAHPAPAEPKVAASFYTEDAELIGTTSAPIKKVEVEDDGSIHVFIDHWPQAEMDAERYRWLRNEASTARKCDPMVCIYPLDAQDLIDGDRLDVAIDAAMEASNEN